MTFEELLDSELEYVISALTMEETEEFAEEYARLVPNENIIFKERVCDRRFQGRLCVGWAATGSYPQIPEFRHFPVYQWSDLSGSAMQIDVSNINELI